MRFKLENTISQKLTSSTNLANFCAMDLNVIFFEGVTSGVGYNYLRTILSIPCGKDTYYKDYHKFFWILDKMQIFEKIGEKTTPVFAF